MQSALKIKMGSHGTLLAVLLTSCLQIKRRIQKHNYSILLEKKMTWSSLSQHLTLDFLTI